MVLEQTLLRCFGWYFNLDYRYMNAGILWGTGWHFYTSYPMLPWFGVMALGYTAAARLKPGTMGWHGRSLRAGLASLFFFGAGRAAGWPIDPQPWAPQRNILFTVFALVNFEKYPPSPAFLTFPVGAALILLAVMPRLPVLPPASRAYGRFKRLHPAAWLAFL